MKSCKEAQAVATSPAFAAASASFNFAKRLVVVPVDNARLVTLVSRLLIWACALSTVTWNVAPLGSEATQVTLDVPTGKVVPDSGLQVNDATATLSLAITLYVTTAPAGLVAFTAKSAGTPSVGGSLSATVTLCEAFALFAEASVAVQVMIVWPTGYGALRACPSLRAPVTVTPGQLSVAVATPGLTDAVGFPGSVTVDTFGGGTTRGSSWSPTVTNCVADAVVPDASVAVHVTVVLPTEYGPAGVAASVIGGVPPAVVGVPRLTCASQRPTSVAMVIAGGGTMASGGALVPYNSALASVPLKPEPPVIRTVPLFSNVAL